MKKAIFFLFALSLLLQGKSQIFTYTYTYDASGNRIKRLCAQVKSLEGESIFDTLTNGLKESYIPAETMEDNLDNCIITLYPNPTRGELVLRINPLPGGSEGRISILGIDGRQCLIITNLLEYNDLDLTTLANGSYIIRLELNGKESIYQLIKE